MSCKIREVKITQAGHKEEKRIQIKEDDIWNLQDNIKYTIIHIIGVPEEEKWAQKGHKTYLKI